MKVPSATSLAGLVGSVVSISGVMFVGYFIWEHWNDLPTVDFSALSVLMALFCLILYLSSVLGNGVAWLILVRSTGASVQAQFAMWVFLISQYGKYVPGNVWHFVSRASLSALGSIHLAQSSYVMMVETMMVATIGVMFSVFALAAGIFGYSVGASELAIAGLLIGILFLLFGPALILAVAKRFWKFWGRAPMPVSIKAPRRSIVMVAALLSGLGLVINAFVLQLLGIWLLDDSVPPLLTLIGVFAFSWTAGFITPGAPGGVGVRDGLLVSLLVPIYGSAGAVTVALTHRMLSVFGDTVALGIGMGLRYTDSDYSEARRP